MALQGFLAAGLAESTAKAYAVGQRRYFQFCLASLSSIKTPTYTVGLCPGIARPAIAVN